MALKKPHVLITFDSMQYPNTGLFYFGRSLGKALIKENKTFDLNFFLSDVTTDFNDDDVKRSYRKKYHRLFFLNTKNIKLFHFTDQFARLKPKKVSDKYKKIMTIHDINQIHENIGEEKLNHHLQKLAERINKCHRIVTISQFAANDILTYFPQVACKLTVIYNGADKLHLPEGHEPAYKPGKPFLFTIGIVSAKKNFHVLPAILANNDFELVIAGIKTPYEKEVMAEAKKYGVENRVKIIGTISDNDKAWYYKNCEAFVFPSIAEGFGLPVIEAMHYGKPVFVSTRTSLPEIAGDCAYYFSDFDGTEMQKVFDEGIQHYRETNPVEKIKAHAEKFNWDDTARQYLSLYQEVLDEK
ncbi:glycosyltransferase family 1 protein [Mucilaginibacter sp. CAU 1740]|uniref:glycosyltransferase family 4 protein n=1 Tax=Mucilaginibacter sp. CAU 1740 TaxID=3140365 RepID=UPI00325C11D7